MKHYDIEKDDRTAVIFQDQDGNRTVLGHILTNRMLDAAEALELLGIDEDEFCEKHGIYMLDKYIIFSGVTP